MFFANEDSLTVLIKSLVSFVQRASEGGCYSKISVEMSRVPKSDYGEQSVQNVQFREIVAPLTECVLQSEPEFLVLISCELTQN